MPCVRKCLAPFRYKQVQSPRRWARRTLSSGDGSLQMWNLWEQNSSREGERITNQEQQAGSKQPGEHLVPEWGVWNPVFKHHLILQLWGRSLTSLFLKSFSTSRAKRTVTACTLARRIPSCGCALYWVPLRAELLTVGRALRVHTESRMWKTLQGLNNSIRKQSQYSVLQTQSSKQSKYRYLQNSIFKMHLSFQSLDTIADNKHSLTERKEKCVQKQQDKQQVFAGSI